MFFSSHTSDDYVTLLQCKNIILRKFILLCLIVNNVLCYLLTVIEKYLLIFNMK